MVRPALLLALLTLAACGGGGASSSGACPADAGNHSAGEPAELAGITAAHNAVRAGVCVGPLTWDPALAATAAAWAQQCQSAGGAILDHNPDRNQGTPSYFGENIFASSGSGGATAAAAVSAWAAEAQQYHPDTNTCDGGPFCGHYTQVVWANTTKIGCARAHCPSLTYGYTIVCDYAPGGNISGQRPY